MLGAKSDGDSPSRLDVSSLPGIPGLKRAFPCGISLEASNVETASESYSHSDIDLRKWFPEATLLLLLFQPFPVLKVTDPAETALSSKVHTSSYSGGESPQ